MMIDYHGNHLSESHARVRSGRNGWHVGGQVVKKAETRTFSRRRNQASGLPLWHSRKITPNAFSQIVQSRVVGPRGPARRDKVR